MRTEGTDALLSAARQAGVRRFVAPSFAPYRYLRQGRPIKTEADPLDDTAMPNTGQTFHAMTYLEQATTAFGGTAPRYGGFYGAANDALIHPVRKRQYPIIGDGGGIFRWLHLDDGASATVLALDHSGPAIYNMVDDEPAPVRGWLPVLANALGAKPPRHIPTWLARLIAGPAMVILGTQACSASNAKAKRELGWTPTIRHGATASRRPTRRSQSPTGRPPKMPWLSSA